MYSLIIFVLGLIRRHPYRTASVAVTLALALWLDPWWLMVLAFIVVSWFTYENRWTRWL